MLTRLLRPAGVITAAVVVVTTGCGVDRQTGPVVVDVAFMKGGGPPTKVQEVDPPAGEQGNPALIVRVLGSGFEDGSVVSFTIDGVGNPEVMTLSTEFVSSGELRATLQIGETAPLDFYDVEVETPRGKKGIGADLFQVVEEGALNPGEPGHVRLDVRLTDQPIGGGISSDGLGDYSDGVDDVDTFIDGQFGQWRFDPDAKQSKKKPADRTVCLDFSDRIPPDDPTTTVEDLPFITDCRAIGGWDAQNGGAPAGNLISMDVGETKLLTSKISFGTFDGLQYRLRWGDPNVPVENRVTAYRVDTHTWTLTAPDTIEAVVSHLPTRGPVTGWTEVGRFRMPFHAVLKRQGSGS